MALGIEVLSKEDRRRKNEQRQKEFAEKYQKKKKTAEANPLSVLQKAYLYQNLVDEFGADPSGPYIPNFLFFSLILCDKCLANYWVELKLKDHYWVGFVYNMYKKTFCC